MWNSSHWDKLERSPETIHNHFKGRFSSESQFQNKPQEAKPLSGQRGICWVSVVVTRCPPQRVHTTDTGRKSNTTSNKNKMQNKVLYKTTKNKAYGNFLNVCLHSNRRDWITGTAFVLKLDLFGCDKDESVADSTLLNIVSEVWLLSCVGSELRVLTM